MSPEVLSAQLAALKRQQRAVRRAALGQRVGRIHRHWWYAAGVIAMTTVGAVGCRSWQQSQRDTALALASIAAPVTTPTTIAPVATDRIPNPLAQLELTAQAKYLIGATADGVLAPMRSTAVVAAMLQQVDPCKLFIGLDDKAYVLVSREPRPGFVPLVTCAVASTTTTTAPKAAT